MTGTSPFIWNSGTLKLKKTMDNYIDTMPSRTEIPLTPVSYSLLLNSISAPRRKDYQTSMMYRGRRIIRG